MSEEQTFTISSNPIAAAFGQAVLIVGVEPEGDDGVRIYLGARWKGVYTVLRGEQAPLAKSVWDGSMGPLWLSPVPGPEHLMKDPEPLQTQ